MHQKFAIHWFRRDLRVEGNAIFLKQVKKFQGRVLGLFIIDQKFLQRSDFSHKRFDFFLATLQELKKSLTSLGSELLVLEGGPEVEFNCLLEKKLINMPLLVSYNRDYEPFSRIRDDKIQKYLNSHGIEVENQRDHLLVEPHELLKEDGTFYKVFTPFSKKWKTLLHNPDIQERIKLSDWSPSQRKKLCTLLWRDLLKTNVKDAHEVLKSYREECKKHHSLQIPQAGFKVALENLSQFSFKLKKYGTDRDYPEREGTSRSSIYLKNGSLTTAQIIKKLKLDKSTISQSHEKFLNELIWREFYYHLLFHRPSVENCVFQKKFESIQWEYKTSHWNAWCKGMTGFPIVDAGMRELNQTGWMHNRVRMIVASFLCKDLLINYQEGERYFMQHLLDGDLAPNNGGWQWAASTGCDAQPYFRIFNPWTQGERFDPNAIYIKKFVPELKNDLAKIIHNPEGARHKSYPKPIVSHDIQRAKALKIYNLR